MPPALNFPPELLLAAQGIRVAFFDVDGVLTDGGLYYGDSGELMKRFDVKDGHALVLAREAGLPTALLTARTSRIVDVRAAELGLAAVMQGRRDKGAALLELCTRLSVPPEACAFMGDDLNDLPALSRAGLAACPADAALEVRQAAHFVAQRPGGQGAVRELVELCLKASHRWLSRSAEMSPR
jgi:3-deoxy-D-manno-octulosonate 8-phosphate phosphatase (KDO 8-P phosphatase)